MTESPMRFSLLCKAIIVSAALLLPTLGCSGTDPTRDTAPAAPVSTRDASPMPTEPIEAPVPPMEGGAAALSIEGSTVVMIGNLDDGFYESFLGVVRGREDEIKTLRVNSGGGNTDEGIKLGHWIFDHGVDVVVDHLCFSSCANYIFTAGRNKTIMADSIVGWHGSEQQDEHIARGLGLTVEELLAREYDRSVAEWGETPTPDGRKQFVEEVLASRPTEVAEEQAFLEKIGVSVDALVYGFLPDQFEGYFVNASDEIGGWTFSIEDMASFGIGNVTYTGDGDYPSERAREEYGIIVLEVP